MPPLCPRLGAMQQIALADDPNEVAAIIDDGNSADPCFTSVSASSRTDVDGLTVITGETITSRAFIGTSCHGANSRNGPRAHLSLIQIKGAYAENRGFLGVSDRHGLGP